MSFVNRDLLKELFEKQEAQSRDVEELKRLKTFFKESEEAKKTKEWAFRKETLSSMKDYVSEFFLRQTASKKEASV